MKARNERTVVIRGGRKRRCVQTGFLELAITHLVTLTEKSKNMLELGCLLSLNANLC